MCVCCSVCACVTKMCIAQVSPNCHTNLRVSRCVVAVA